MSTSSTSRLAASARRLSELDEVELEIEKLVSGGEGFGRFEGIPIFVPRSAPGDRVRARLVERRSGYGRAEILELLAAGPSRREPPCPHYARCGGCDLQHIEDGAQLRFKVAAAAETLRRLGRIETPSSVAVVAGQSWGYRTRTQLQLSETERGVEIGYFERRSHDLVPITSCPVLVPELEGALSEVAQSASETTHRRIDLSAGNDGRWTSAPKVEGLPRGEVETRVDGFCLNHDASCFFQGHRQLVERLVALVVESAGREFDRENSADQVVFDLFAGVGLFSLPLSRIYGKVVAVENDRAAVRFARRNVQRNHVDNVTVVKSSVESWVGNLPRSAARVVVDPPRVGLSLKVRSTLMRRAPRAMTYVSCDAATLARDLASMSSAYRVEGMTFVDLFPQTGHLELVVDLRRRSELELQGRAQG